MRAPLFQESRRSIHNKRMMRMRLTILVSLCLVVAGVAIVSLIAQERTEKPVVEVFKSPT